jgi:ABC-type transporter Mla subunit MlaD
MAMNMHDSVRDQLHKALDNLLDAARDWRREQNLHNHLNELEARIMARFDDVKAMTGELKTYTDKLGVSVQALIDNINNTAGDGLNGPQTEEHLAELATLRDVLKAIGTNADTVFPPLPPPPEPLPD